MQSYIQQHSKHVNNLSMQFEEEKNCHISATLHLFVLELTANSLFFTCITFRMYSSNIAPPMKLSSDLHHFNYHPNAFNAHTTAKINNHNACATGNAAYQLPPSDNIIVRPSAADDGARKQRKHSSSTIFDDTNICSARNKFSHGAYDSTFSHNIFDNNPKPRSQLNERM